MTLTGINATLTNVATNRHSRRNTPTWRKSLPAYVFLLPWLVGAIAITLGPMLASLYLSFTDYHLLGGAKWLGLENYRKLLIDDSRFRTSVVVTVKYVVFSVPIHLAFALLVALVLNRGLRGLAVYRSVFYLPSLLGTSVAVATLWREVFGDQGLFSRFTELLGFPASSWVSDPDNALKTLIVLNVWTFGSPMLIFLAGLRQIPTELYEAAKVDSAGAIRRFTSITVPLLTPVIFFNFVLQMIHSFQAFTPAFIISGGDGGPADSTLFYTLYLYQQGFANFNMGYAAAMAWMLLVVIGGVTAANFAVSRFWVFYGGE